MLNQSSQLANSLPISLKAKITLAVQPSYREINLTDRQRSQSISEQKKVVQVPVWSPKSKFKRMALSPAK